VGERGQEFAGKRQSQRGNWARSNTMRKAAVKKNRIWGKGCVESRESLLLKSAEKGVESVHYNSARVLMVERSLCACF